MMEAEMRRHRTLRTGEESQPPLQPCWDRGQLPPCGLHRQHGWWFLDFRLLIPRTVGTEFVVVKSSGLWQLVTSSRRSAREWCFSILPLLHSSLKNAVWLLRKYSTKLGDMASKTDFTAHRLNGIKSNLGSQILSLIVRGNGNTNI